MNFNGEHRGQRCMATSHTTGRCIRAKNKVSTRLNQLVVKKLFESSSTIYQRILSSSDVFALFLLSIVNFFFLHFLLFFSSFYHCRCLLRSNFPRFFANSRDPTWQKDTREADESYAAFGCGNRKLVRCRATFPACFAIALHPRLFHPLLAALSLAWPIFGTFSSFQPPGCSQRQVRSC